MSEADQLKDRIQELEDMVHDIEDRLEALERNGREAEMMEDFGY